MQFSGSTPLRGAISVGEAILDRETGTYLGWPIIEAARTERLQKWIGLSFTASFSKPDFSEVFYLDTVLPYKSHYEDRMSPDSTGMVVDWPRRWRETRQKNIRLVVSAMNADATYSEYYERTLKFIDFSEQNHDWFKKQSHLDYG